MPLVRFNPAELFINDVENTLWYRRPGGNFVELPTANADTDCVIDGVAYRTVIVPTGNVAHTPIQSGRISIATLGSGTQVFTLPAVPGTGDFFGFICGDAAGEILVNPGAAAHKFAIKASEGGASVVTSANVGIKNTAATNVKGDRIVVVFDGVDTWWALNQSGIWASQP